MRDLDENCPATVAIHRNLGWYGYFHPLYVFIDGRPAGRMYGNGTKEFPARPGEHWGSVSLARVRSAPVRVHLPPGDCAGLACASNQEPPHPWHARGVAVLLVFGGASMILGCLFPQAVNAFQNAVFAEVMLASVFGRVGMILYFGKVASTPCGRPALFLTPVPADDGGP